MIHLLEIGSVLKYICYVLYMFLTYNIIHVQIYFLNNILFTQFFILK